MTYGLHNIACSRFSLGADHGRAFGDSAQRFAQIAGAADKGNRKFAFIDVAFLVGGCQHLALINVIYFKSFENLRLHKVSDARFGHHRNGNAFFNFRNHRRIGHPRHAAFFADVGGNPLQRHYRNGSRFFSYFSLLGICYIHDDAAFEHLRQLDI